MKKLVSIIILCLGCLGILGAQNVWKPISSNSPILGAASNGDLYAMGGYSGLLRSQDEGETWQVVLGYETGFSGYFNQHCFAVSPEGRICVFNDNQQTVVYSDDDGDTWQQTPSISSCAMPDKTGICAPTNDIFVVWAENGEIDYSLDGGETWEGWIPDFMNADNGPAISDLLVNENGDVYLGLRTLGGDGGICHSILSDIQNWELVAAEGINIMDMAFDPEGNVVACGWRTEGSVGFQHTPGFYLFDGTSLAIGDGGIVYTPQYLDLQAVLSYSTDHGEHFTEIGEHLPLVDIAPGGDNARLFKGADNHLYFDGGGEYWKSVRDADHIQRSFPLENTAWVQFYRSMYEDSTYYQLGIKGDTVVNETAYKKVINCAHLGYPIEGECFGGIREDADGKCYFMSFVPGIYAPWPLHYFCEVNTDYPLYDFSLSVCDVFQTDGGTPNVVFDTDEMELNGSTRKVLWFDNNCDNGNYYDYQWIEGIGSTHSLLYPIQWEPDNGPEYRLVEVWQDEELLYRNPIFEEDFPYDNMRWSIYYRNLYLDWAPYIQIGIKGDTIVDGTTYHKVIKCTSFGTVIDGDCFGGIRVETDGKWYFRLFSEENVPQYLYLDMEPNTERLIYDFSLSVCDGFEYEGQYWMSVFDIDEIGINGSMRNRFWFDSNCEEGDHPHDWNWIEGIGSNYGLLYAIQAFPLDGSAYHLGEVYQDGELIYSDPYFHDYVPMIKEGNQRQKWNVVYMASMNYPNDYFTEIQSIRDNITLDGVDYKLVWKEDVYDSKRIAGAVREDDKRVYFRRYWQQSYQDEVLLYDFNLSVGDTVSVGWSDYQLIVLEESQVQVNGTTRRQLGLAMYFADGTIGEIEEYWIEGVGSTYGFLNSGYEGWVGAFVYLLCYHENGNLIWDNEEFDDCVMNSDGAPATFAPQGAEWYFDKFNPWGTHPEYERFFVEGDTIIQGHQCSIIDQRFVDTGHDGGEYVYEEDNKVYWFNPTTNAFTTLYDFDAEAGESWDYEVGECSHQVVVDSVGSVTWNGHTYRTQWVRFNEDVQYYSGKIMEGIGYERGLFPSVYVCNGWEIFDASEIEYLRCYVNDGEMLYHEGGYDCEQTTVTPPSHPEWYYEILNDDGTITYQYMYQAGDTIINDEPTQILVKINTLYDKGLRDEVTHEYVFELNGKLYWWNKRTHSFTVLYDYEAEVGDSWNIMVGIEPPLTMTVDAVDYVEYEGRTYRVMHVSDPDDLFSGDIVCGIGHLTSFFPERLMRNSDGFRVEGLRCYWVEDELVFNLDGEEECDAIYSEVHGIEEGGPSTGSGTAGAVMVYPNPTDGVLVIETQGIASLQGQTYRICNLMGQVLLQGQIMGETQRIDVSNLPDGMYFITFAGETQKFVVR